MKFRKRPVVIEAFHWQGDVSQLIKWVEETGGGRVQFDLGAVVHIPTLEGEMEAQLNDWIIRGIKGELYPCKPDIFAATYERVE